MGAGWEEFPSPHVTLLSPDGIAAPELDDGIELFRRP